jgi:hypothetical protein
VAFTISVEKKTVHGDERVHHCVVTADAAAGSVQTGLSYINQVVVSLKSATTAAYKARINVLESGTASVGSVALSGVASGDEFFVTVYGR